MSNVVDRFRPLFHPRGIIVTGVSTHPGKFGTVTFHNLLSRGYEGEIFPINREGVESFGRPTYKSVSEVPKGRADLAFICTPNQINEDLLRECAKVGVRAAFVASAGYGESEDGREMEQRLVALGEELGMLMLARHAAFLERKLVESDHAANYDDLTGLLRRNPINRVLDKELERHARTGSHAMRTKTRASR